MARARALSGESSVGNLDPLADPSLDGYNAATQVCSQGTRGAVSALTRNVTSDWPRDLTAWAVA